MQGPGCFDQADCQATLDLSAAAVLDTLSTSFDTSPRFGERLSSSSALNGTCQHT